MVEAIDQVTLALWAVNLGRPLNGISAWVAGIEQKMQQTKRQGADMLILPEYACEQWLSFKPEGLRPDQEIAWMAEQGAQALPLLAPLAERYDMALLAGTMPVAHGKGGFRNRAWLFLPDGRQVGQDKLCLTPFEKDPDAWQLEPGELVHVVQWRGLKLATCICLDVELPALSAMLAPLEPDLILVPSMTAGLSGYSRVFGCAKARAVELMAVVAAVGVVGVAQGTTQNDSNVSGCSVFLPCEPTLGDTGLYAEIPPVAEDEADGPLLIARDIPIATIRALRAGAAEVWPGAWRAEPVKIHMT
ncbi:nitrilase-related carbon-nitrogen hydrolase [Rhodoligotrophos defluvii]|uniref:nitrilase-related carbon-nitrogen hydrolase n=1 Tax=Rhodoligotrophos defluvii TaxID=2561934 RepID=UPI0010C95603|nr:nitrilase-related carbon-nitrogen hydrolase [Rhodoligotrophos defluvii]